MILTAKYIQNRLNVSKCTALKYINDMKEYYRPPSKRLTVEHYNDYFAIPNTSKKG